MTDKKPSLYPSEHVCFICKTPFNVEQHHIFKASRRPISDREGATVFLCHEHHQGRMGVHSDSRFDAWLKRDCQRRWMEREHATADDFREVFYASYLDEEQS